MVHERGRNAHPPRARGDRAGYEALVDEGGRPRLAELGFHKRFWSIVMRFWPMPRADRVPWTPLGKPLAEARVAIVTSCGVHLASDVPFDLDAPGGDVSWRALPGDARAADVAITHGHYDTRDARRDLNVVFPLDRLRELAAEGVVGSVAAWHYGFMGSIMRPAPLIARSAPEVAAQLKADAVDVVLLTPC